MPKKIYLLLIPNLVLLGCLIFQVGLACEMFLASLVYLPLGIMSLVCIIIGLGIGLLSKKKKFRTIILFIAVFLSYLFVPDLTRARQTIEFRIRQPGYLQVVDLVRQGKFASQGPLNEVDDAHQYLLPCSKQFAFETNERGLFVLFFTSRRWLGEFAGYIYSSDGQPPTISQFREVRSLSPNQWTRIEQADSNWFYVVWDH